MKALLDHWMFREYAPAMGGLPLYRIVFAFLLLVLSVPGPTIFATLPDSFYLPQIGVGALFTAFPPRWYCEVLNFLMVLGAVSLMFGYRVRLTCLLLAALYVVFNSFAYAVGKVFGDVFVLVALVTLASSAWGGRYSMDAVRVGSTPRHAYPVWPLCLLMFVIGLCFSTAFYSKASSGWLSPNLEACRGQMLLNYIGAERPSVVADFMFSIHQHLFWKMFDYSTVMLEGAFLLCSARLLAMRFITASACLFHAGIYFSMDIFFWANLIVYLSLFDGRIFLRWQVGRRLLRSWMALVRTMRPWHLVVIAVLVRLLYLATGCDWRTSDAFQDVAAGVTMGAGLAGLAWFFWTIFGSKEAKRSVRMEAVG